MTDTEPDAPGPARRVPPHMTATWEAATSDPDPLSALGATRALGALLSTWEAQLVAEAVAAGATWESIGGSVGVSRQAAWERFHHHVPDFTRQVGADARALRQRQRHEWEEFVQQTRAQARSRRHRGR